MKRLLSICLLAVITAVPTAANRPAAAADPSTITISQGVDATTLNPLADTVTPTFNVVQHMYERLVDNGDTPGSLQPRLAVSWKRISPTTEEYKLRRNVRFSNGDPFTSADVRYTMEWIKDPKNGSTQTSYLRDVDRIETPDPYTVRLIANSPRAIAPGMNNKIFIIDAKYFQSHPASYVSDHPIGTGAYVLREWKRDDQLTLDANPTWWNGKPKIEHVIFKPIPEAGARVAALKTGATDLITNVPSQYATQLEGSLQTRMASVRSQRQLFIAFNTLQPGPQQNKLVRQAINYAVDVPAIVKNVMGGRAYESTSVIPANYFGYDPSVPAYKHDLAKAKALLAKAGYPDGKGLSFVLQAPVGRYNRDREVAEAIGGQLTAAGMSVTPRIQEWTPYNSLLNRRGLSPMYELGWNHPGADADGVVSVLLAGNAAISTYSNREADQLIVAGSTEIDPGKRKAIYKKLATVLYDDAPWIPLFEFEDLYAVSRRVVFKPRGDEYLRAYEMVLK